MLYDAIRHGHTTVITELLRAGASLDACNGDESAEEIMQRHESDHSALAGNEDWCAIKRLVAGCAKIHKLQAPASRHRRDVVSVSTQIAGVRQHGSYKRYARSFHRDVLTVRGLAQRGKLLTDDPVLSFLARRADNGVVWHVLEYWRATN